VNINCDGGGVSQALPLSDTRVFPRSWLHPLLEQPRPQGFSLKNG